MMLHQDHCYKSNHVRAQSQGEGEMKEELPLENDAPRLVLDDFVLGELLGSGSFASVYQVEPSDHLEIAREKRFSRASSNRSLGSTDSQFFALKTLKGQDDESVEFQMSVNDFKIEAEILAGLPEHQNIIIFEGMSKGFFSAPEYGFIVLECLRETLDRKLRKLKNRKVLKKRSWLSTSFERLLASKQKEDPEQRHRIRDIGIGIARALAFIHENEILYRDLKPANIGFDDEGTVKIFDFGLAKFYKKSEPDRLLTNMVGTPRYMAPEVVKGVKYGFPADVHSYAILLWEVCALKSPFSKSKSLDHLFERVCVNNERPRLNRISNPAIADLLRRSWDVNPDRRPSFASLVNNLEVFEAGA